MNRIVRENYPVSKLPEELQREFPQQDEVTLTVEANANPAGGATGIERPTHVKSLEELFAMAAPTFKSLDEVTAHVRSLRDDWS